MISHILAIALAVFIDGEERTYMVIIEPEKDGCMTPKVQNEKSMMFETEDHKFVAKLTVKCSRGS